MIEALRALPGPRARGERLHLRGELLSPEMVGRLAAPGLANSQGKPVANRDLWEPLLTLALDAAVRSRSPGSRAIRGTR